MIPVVVDNDLSGTTMDKIGAFRLFDGMNLSEDAAEAKTRTVVATTTPSGNNLSWKQVGKNDAFQQQK